MFLLDTNVVSESRRIGSGRAAPAVVAWLGATDPGVTFVSAMSLFELELGIVRVERRDPVQGDALRRWLDGIVKPAFAGRILAMDSAVAVACAALQVPDPVSERHGWIAATALVHGLTLVTRNVGGFASTRVRLLDPWQEDAEGGCAASSSRLRLRCDENGPRRQRVADADGTSSSATGAPRTASRARSSARR